MKNPRWKLSKYAVFAGLLFFSGCATTPYSHLYVLIALSEAGRAPESLARPTLRLQSVSLPGVLHQPNVITEASPVLIQSSEFERWAEPLEGQISEVLARNLTALLPGHRVVRGRLHPQVKADIEVHVEVLQFGGILGDRAWLELRWSQDREGAPPGLHRWRGQRILEGDDVQAYVLAQSELLAEASQTMAKQLSDG